MEAILHAKMFVMIVSPLCKEVSKQTNKKSPLCFRNMETKAHLDSGHTDSKYGHMEDQDYNLATTKT